MQGKKGLQRVIAIAQSKRQKYVSNQKIKYSFHNSFPITPFRKISF